MRSFFGTPPRELQARLLDGDPLGMRGLCTDRRDELALLISSHRLFQRAIARAAYEGSRYRGEPPLDAWSRSCVDKAIADLLEEDRMAAREGTPVEDGDDYLILTTRLDVSPEIARAMCVAFNELPDAVRRCYFGLSNQGLAVRELAVAEGVPDSQIRGWIAQALRTLLSNVNARGKP